MAKLYSIYFQKEKSGASVYDTKAQWGIVCKDFPFVLFDTTKDIPTRSWPDGDGEDVYFPDRLRFQAYDLEVFFAYQGEMGSANAKIAAFINYLTGKSDTGTSLKVYDTYTKIGRKGLYVKSVSNDAFARKTDEGDVIVFKVKFRVTDPVTDIVLSI